MIQKPRGTIDIFGQYANDFYFIQDKLISLSKLFNFQRIETPIFENFELFKRNENDSSDIVNKEMYVFNDKGDRTLALRPEGTAPVIRSIIENKLIHKISKPFKLFYFSPMFRYERPQSGRQRQFHQYGIEIIGCESIYNEFESIFYAIQILQTLNINNYILKINYIGNFDSRNKWLKSLKDYFSKYKNELSEDSINRIDSNPMRILDDKVDGQKDFVINAPSIENFISEEEKYEINTFYKILKENNINFEIDKTLVRGLDYYTGFVFEVVSKSNNLKGQSTLIGGGRYSKLFKELGHNEDVTCFGFAIGIERLLIAYKDENQGVDNSQNIDIYISNISDDNLYTFNLLNLLRKHNISCETNFNIKKMDKHFKYSQRFNPKFIIIIGNEEIKTNKLTIKNQKTLNEEKIYASNLIEYFKK